MDLEAAPGTLPLEPLLYEVKKVIVGQDHLLERMLVALLARGHLLVEGVPGLAKTLAVKSLAGAIGGRYQRIQFTPDLVPADLVGTRIYNQKTGEFTTTLGPVFTNLLLADEINRAPAKVQSALLEVMQEHQVTIAHETHAVPCAVPRPGDPESDRDRGHLRAARGAGRPVHAQGPRRLPLVDRGVRDRRPRDRARWSRRIPVLSTDELLRLQAQADRVYTDPALTDYAVRLASATRDPAAFGMPELARYITYGASPRASINLVLAGRSLAFLRGREYTLPQDMLDVARDVMRHRMVLSFEALSDDVTADQLLTTILAAVRIPVVPLREPSDVRHSA